MARDDLSIEGGQPDVRAAGGVVLDRGQDGTRVAVIHRPKYMDWSLPKGKLEPEEDWKAAALREVEEETGHRCEALGELPPISYRDRQGRSKLVRYWLMEPVAGSFAPHDEVDDLRWLSPAEAEELLTYEHDRELVKRALRKHRLRRVLRPFRRS
jgi:8-oxo-dGTP diphosphatase